MRFRHFLLLFYGLFLLPSFAQDASNLLSAKEIFKPSITQTQANDDYRTTVNIAIPKGYYLYADRTRLSSHQAQGLLEKSDSISKHDPYFGEVSVWYDNASLTLTHSTAANEFTLFAQGCNENDGICYPPTQWDLRLDPNVSAAQFEAVNAPNPTTTGNVFLNKNDWAPTSSTANMAFSSRANTSLFPEKKVLTEDEAFISTALDAQSIALQIADAHYLYRDSIKLKRADGSDIAVELPEGLWHDDPFFGKQRILQEQVILRFAPNSVAEDTPIVLQFQGCAEVGICYPPMQRHFVLTKGGRLISVDNTAEFTPDNVPDSGFNNAPNQALTNTSNNAPTHFIATALGQNYLAALPLIFVLGIAVSFTGCAYPLLPIVSSLIVGNRTNNRKSYYLILTYVLAIGLTMGALGALFGIFNLNLQLILQKPLAIAVAALFFVLLALSMFDLLTLQLPSQLQSRIDKLTRAQQGGSYASAATMGALSTLVVSPCATPVLTALLLFTTQTTTLKGALALFIFGIGTGVPLLLFASALRRFMPKAGDWMTHLKRIMAFVMLGIGFWLVARIAAVAYSLWIWAIYAALIGAYLLPHVMQTGKKGYVLRVMLIVTLVASFAFGQQGLQQFFAPQQTQHNGAKQGVSFVKLDNYADIQQAIKTSNRATMLYFYADWCISCKTWEKEIWQNPDFAPALANYQLIKADITNFTKAHHALLQQLNLVGPPAMLRFPPQGEISQAEQVIIGEISPEKFASLL